MSKRFLWYPILISLTISFALADMSEYRKADPRLEKKVTLAVNHVKLEEVAQSLAEQSGIDIKAGTGKRDWKVRERKVTIHAKDIQVGQMLEEISRLIGFHLSREGKEGSWNYVIWQDQKGRQFEEEMLIAAKEAEAKRAADIRRGTLDSAESALKMTPEEALKNREKDPRTAFLGGTRSGRGWAQFLSSFESSFPIEYGLMMRGKKVTIPVSGLSPTLQAAVADIMAGKTMPPLNENQGTPEPANIVIDGLVADANLGVLGIGGVCSLNARLPTAPDHDFQAGLFPMASADSKLADAFGKMLLALEDGLSHQEANEKIGKEVMSPESLADMLAHKSPTEENPPTDPKLLREIEIKKVESFMPNQIGGMQAESQGKMIAEIARATGESVLQESYSTMLPLSAFMKKGKQQYYKVLVAAEKAGCTWELGDGTLRIRPEDWAIQRSREIPESFLDYYKGLLAKNGAFTLDELTGLIAALTDAQLEGRLMADQDLFPAVVSAAMNQRARKMLRAYGTMGANQKTALVTEAGLGFGLLTDTQWEYVNDIITDQLGGIEIVDGSVKLAPLLSGDQPSHRTFEIVVAAPDEEKPRTITISVSTPTKEYLEQQRKKMQEAMEKAMKEQAEKQKAEGQTAPK